MCSGYRQIGENCFLQKIKGLPTYGRGDWTLEIELKAELELTRYVALSVVGVQDAEIIVRDITRGRAAEKRRVEDVKGFQAELKAEALIEGERFV